MSPEGKWEAGDVIKHVEFPQAVYIVVLDSEANHYRVVLLRTNNYKNEHGDDGMHMLLCGSRLQAERGDGEVGWCYGSLQRMQESGKWRNTGINLNQLFNNLKDAI